MNCPELGYAKGSLLMHAEPEVSIYDHQRMASKALLVLYGAKWILPLKAPKYQVKMLAAGSSYA